MAYVVGVLSQKGGVGKSTICRLLAREFVTQGWNAKIADLDSGQGTSFNWLRRRTHAGIEPYVPVQIYPSLKKALGEIDSLDVLLIDGPPNSDRLTRDIAEASDLIIMPSGVSHDDRDPAKNLARELIEKYGIPKDRIVFTLSRVPAKAPAAISEAYYDLIDSGFDVLAGAVPEQGAYLKAMNDGRALTETPYSKLNEQADEVAQGAINRLAKAVEKRERVA